MLIYVCECVSMSVCVYVNIDRKDVKIIVCILLLSINYGILYHYSYRYMRFRKIINKSIFETFIMINYDIKVLEHILLCIFIKCIALKSYSIILNNKIDKYAQNVNFIHHRTFFSISAAMFLKRSIPPFLVIRFWPTFDMLFSGKFATRNIFKTFSCNLFRVRPFFLVILLDYCGYTY